ncbi:sigma-54-dependent transcriptional regulator [Chelativorans salis]|uniref:DNA-binding transcriptional regulator NtrC n=1 Tax=Chelativorans salis TaxID=2978478 RepID=A0ABT2LWF0_9HYPH|nr:sigma-54 dependent transcriptional regulator [Chelativorans sp. EGI FJ00035]MCT7377524.1 sigma-54 dependent transcriptional regulator [Chelativorans sp. EGI FJ00035]
MPDTILIVDDDPVQRRLLDAMVRKLGYAPVLAEGGEEALEAVNGARPAEPRAVVMDLMMPGMDGIDVMRRMRQAGVDVPVIVQTAKGGVETAVAAMRAGAFDFVVKPVSPERLGKAIHNALKVEALEGTVRRKRRREKGFSFSDIVTGSPTMERVTRLARKAAASDIPILIEGESGVGKELIARAIRGESARRTKPFVTVNCGAIPENLVESILFGHEKGSFTGATEKHTGKFIEANTGTLFLDEIGDLPADVQVKLLRAVQEGEVDPVGARGTVKVDIRLISASNQNLLERVKEGRFREDLFYRLNVFPIMMPPLRERKEDIPLLVQHFIARFADAVPGAHVSGITAEALDMLSAYDWPGNIRQLENAVFRGLVLSEGEMLTVAEFPQIRAQVDGIDEALLAPPEQEAAHESAAGGGGEAPLLRQPPHPALLRVFGEDGHIRTLEATEREMIRLAIEHYDGQMSEVARRLGIGRSTLYRKLKEMGIDPAEERGRSD